MKNPNIFHDFDWDAFNKAQAESQRQHDARMKKFWDQAWNVIEGESFDAGTDPGDENDTPWAV